MRFGTYILIPLLLGCSSVSAMGCGPAETITEAVKRIENSHSEEPEYTFVFKARVVRVLPNQDTKWMGSPALFSVVEAYKGTPPPTLTVYFNSAGDDRPLLFHEGDVFLLSTYRAWIQRPGSPKEYFSQANVCSLRKLVQAAR